jgi:hypothetical protein
MAKAGNLMARRSARRTQVAVVMYPGVLPLELIGTVSVLNRLGLNTGFRTVTVAARQEPLATDTPLRVAPQSTFAATPHPRRTARSGWLTSVRGRRKQAAWNNDFVAQLLS